MKAEMKCSSKRVIFNFKKILKLYCLGFKIWIHVVQIWRAIKDWKVEIRDL